jgi:hypothetical protein
VTITDNAFTGADRVYSADTTDITATGNTL